MERVERKVISLGGSTIYNNSDDGINAPYLSELVRLLKGNSGDKYIIVVGGGHVAREYIKAARGSGIDKEGQDFLGIASSHLNAMMLSMLINNKRIPTRHIQNIFSEYQGFLKQYNVIVTGGTIPGHTTDRVAVQCAARYGDGHLVNVTNVGGIFDEDPKINPDAKIIDEIAANQLIEKWGTEHVPGMNIPIGVRSIQQALEDGVYIHIVGEDIEDLKKALFAREGYRGTFVIPE